MEHNSKVKVNFIKRHISVKKKTFNEPVEEMMYASVSPKSAPPVTMRIKSVQFQDQIDKEIQNRKSFGGIEELVQCPVCYEQLNKPKMLPCQHTFCLSCLGEMIKDNCLCCPTCRKNYHASSPNFLDEFPSNLYIDNLLDLLKNQTNAKEPTSPVEYSKNPKICQKRCCHCQSIVELHQEYCCEHCKQTFCGVCWSAHIMELKTQIGSLVEQLNAGSERLKHKFESYKDHNEQLSNQITMTAEMEIQKITEKKIKLLGEAGELLKNGETSANTLQELLKAMQKNIKEYVSTEFDTINDDKDKVNAFMNFHRIAVDLLKDVSSWSEKKYVFDQENFCIGNDIHDPVEIDNDENLTIESKLLNNPLESAKNMTQYYRTKNFIPKKIWRKCPRPAGIGVPSWSDHLYVCSSDSQNIIVIERSKGKIVDRIAHPNMLCPLGIAFTKTREEILVSDKWNHCVHVFSKTGTYLRCIGSKGNKDGYLKSPEGICVEPNEINVYVCDTGNDRIQVFNIVTGDFVKCIGILSQPQLSKSAKCTQLNGPTSIAATYDSLVVADSGNRRIKIYSYEGEKIREFGSQGVLKGQFQHPEAIAVDPLGFIIVGDSGNARIQIFEPNGHFLRVFGGKGRNPGQYGWISGLCITPQLELIASDTKNHQINIY